MRVDFPVRWRDKVVLGLVSLVLLSQCAVAVHGIRDIHADANRAGLHDNSDARPCQLCHSLHHAAPAPLLARLAVATPRWSVLAAGQAEQLDHLLPFSLCIRPPPAV